MLKQSNVEVLVIKSSYAYLRSELTLFPFHYRVVSLRKIPKFLLPARISETASKGRDAS